MASFSAQTTVLSPLFPSENISQQTAQFTVRLYGDTETTMSNHGAEAVLIIGICKTEI